jgi:hypothetical protein
VGFFDSRLFMDNFWRENISVTGLQLTGKLFQRVLTQLICLYTSLIQSIDVIASIYTEKDKIRVWISK